MIKTLKYLLLCLFAVASFFPFYWMFITAFSPDSFIGDFKFLPIPFYIKAMEFVLKAHPFEIWIMNTSLIATIGTLGCLLFASMAAFSFACLKWRYRDLVFYILFASTILPGFLSMIPKFFLFNALDGIDTYWAIFIPMWFSMFSVFLLRQAFFSMPRGILNAARIDGASLWKIFWRLVLPNSKPTLFALFLIQFIANWNSFLWPVIIIRTVGKQTIPVGLAGFYEQYQTSYNYIMAGNIVGLIPIFIMFVLFQKHVQRGLNMRITF